MKLAKYVWWVITRHRHRWHFIMGWWHCVGMDCRLTLHSEEYTSESLPTYSPERP